MRNILTDKYLWDYIKNNPLSLTEGNFILLKIGKKKHLFEMQRGNLYTRPLGYYSGLYPSELTKGQLDSMEGFVRIVKQSKIVVQGIVIGQAEQLIERVGVNTPILCFVMPKFTRTDLNKWAITFNQNIVKDFTKGNSSDYGVLLIDGLQLKQRIEIMNIKCYGKKIEYTDKEFDTNEDILSAIFRKRLSYSHQQEFRIAFKGRLNLPESLIIPIGDISKFSRILPISILQGSLLLQKSTLKLM